MAKELNLDQASCMAFANHLNAWFLHVASMCVCCHANSTCACVVMLATVFSFSMMKFRFFIE